MVIRQRGIASKASHYIQLYSAKARAQA